MTVINELSVDIAAAGSVQRGKESSVFTLPILYRRNRQRCMVLDKRPEVIGRRNTGLLIFAPNLGRIDTVQT